MDLGRRISRSAEYRYVGRGLMIRALLSALLFLTSSLSAQAANDIAEIQQGLGSPIIVDVRSEGEYASGAIDGALNYPLKDLPGTLLDMGVELDEEVIVYCRSGRRSAQAKTLLKQAGFQLVFDGGPMTQLEQVLERSEP
jgi:phage shock protein E